MDWKSSIALSLCLTQSEKMSKQQLKWIVTGNFTADGAVAYLQAENRFSRQLVDALVFENKEDAEAARKAAAGREALVTDPYVTEVADADKQLDVLTARERIRSQGPSTPYGRLSPTPRVV